MLRLGKRETGGFQVDPLLKSLRATSNHWSFCGTGSKSTTAWVDSAVVRAIAVGSKSSTSPRDLQHSSCALEN
jgi:hypothetical protein